MDSFPMTVGNNFCDHLLPKYLRTLYYFYRRNSLYSSTEIDMLAATAEAEFMNVQFRWGFET